MKTILNRHVEEVANEIAFNNGFINFEDFKQKLKSGDSYAWEEFEYMLNEITSSVVEEVENYYID